MKDLLKLLESTVEILASLKRHESIVEQKARKRKLKKDLREIKIEKKMQRIRKKIKKRKSKLKA